MRGSPDFIARTLANLRAPGRRRPFRRVAAAMLVIISLLFLASVREVSAQTIKRAKHPANPATNTPAASAAAAATAAQQTRDQVQSVQLARKQFVPADPWRVMDETTNYARGRDWVQFEGRITRISPGEIELRGWFGEPLFYLLPGNTTPPEKTFSVRNYPRAVFAGQLLSRNDRLVAFRKPDSAGGETGLDYGKIYAPKLTDEQKARIAQNKVDGDAKILAFQKELAEKGDPYGQYKMGLRYAAGDGVEKDPARARELLAQAAAQGNRDAADALAKLPAENPAAPSDSAR